jgi:hypothetical protein
LRRDYRKKAAAGPTRAGGHQETLNRALAETRILDWLDETLAHR